MTDLEKIAYRLIRRRVATTRAELARCMQISRPTASVITDSLLNKKLISLSGKKKIARGKLPVELQPLPEAFEVIGIDIGYNKRIIGVRVDAMGKILQIEELECSEKSADALANVVVKLVSKMRSPTTKGIGVALAAVVNEYSKEVLECSNYQLSGNVFFQTLQANNDLPVYLANRARMAAFSEQFGGATDKIQDFLLLSLGSSIGSSLSLNGKIYNGLSYCSGEIRNFLTLDSGGKIMTLEEALSESRHATPDEYAKSCSYAVKQLLSLLDLQQIVLFGRFEKIAHDFPERLKKQLAPDLNCQIFLAAFGEFSAARGAALAVSEISQFQR